MCIHNMWALLISFLVCGLKAPEVFMGRSYSEKVDVYSYAICLAGKPLGIYICTWTSPSITELSSLGMMSRVDDRARSLPGHGATGLRRAGRRRFSLSLSSSSSSSSSPSSSCLLPWASLYVASHHSLISNCLFWQMACGQAWART